MIRSAGYLGAVLTLDPQTGFYRIWIWNAALVYIPQSPMVGYGHELIGNAILDASVNSIWLVYSLRFGIPMVVLLVLTNIAAFLPPKPSPVRDAKGVHMARMSRAFTTVLLLFMFSGLTVHFLELHVDILGFVHRHPSFT